MARDGETATADGRNDPAVATRPLEVVTAWRAAGAAAGPDHTVSSRVAARILASIPAGTRRAYTADWSRFVTWCASAGRTALPSTPETLAEFISAVADQGYAPASLSRMMAAIRSIHRLGGQQPPDNTAALAIIKSYRNERVAAGISNSQRKAAVLSVRHLRELVVACDVPLKPGGRPRLELPVARDRLVLVLGWAMMARRGELHALDLEDVSEVEHGLEVMVRRGKTDQSAYGHIVAIPYGSDPLTCPVRLWRTWTGLLAENGITSGALFRRIHLSGRVLGRLSDQGIANVVCGVAERAAGWARPESGRTACAPAARPAPTSAGPIRC